MKKRNILILFLLAMIMIQPFPFLCVAQAEKSPFTVVDSMNFIEEIPDGKITIDERLSIDVVLKNAVSKQDIGVKYDLSSDLTEEAWTVWVDGAERDKNEVTVNHSEFSGIKVHLAGNALYVWKKESKVLLRIIEKVESSGTIYNVTLEEREVTSEKIEETLEGKKKADAMIEDAERSRSKARKWLADVSSVNDKIELAKRYRDDGVELYNTVDNNVDFSARGKYEDAKRKAEEAKKEADGLVSRQKSIFVGVPIAIIVIFIAGYRIGKGRWPWVREV